MGSPVEVCVEVNIREYQKLQDELAESYTTQHRLEERSQALEVELKKWKKAFETKDDAFQRSMKTVSLMETHPNDATNEIVERNVALEKQVESLQLAIRDTMDKNASSPHTKLEDSSTSHQHHQDLMLVLAKFNRKEEELGAMKNQCEAWEKQVMDLKFEIQSMKFSAKEQAEAELVYTTVPRSHGSTVHETRVCHFTSTAKQRNIDIELQKYKTLAQERAQLWKKTEAEKNYFQYEWIQCQHDIQQLEKTLKQQLGDAEVIRLEKDSVMEINQRLQEELCQTQERASRVQNTLTTKMCEIEQLNQEVQEAPLQRKLEHQHLIRLIKELRNEIRLLR